MEIVRSVWMRSFQPNPPLLCLHPTWLPLLCYEYIIRGWGGGV